MSRNAISMSLPRRPARSVLLFQRQSDQTSSPRNGTQSANEKGRSSRGLLAQLDLDAAGARRAGVELDARSVEAGRLGRELAHVSGFDAREPPVLPERPTDPAAARVPVVESLEPVLVVTRVMAADGEGKAAVGQVQQVRSGIDLRAVPRARLAHPDDRFKGEPLEGPPFAAHGKAHVRPVAVVMVDRREQKPERGVVRVHGVAVGIKIVGRRIHRARVEERLQRRPVPEIVRL
ncbi:MAG: hypothetical protein DMG07_09135, partial [Acidobacteria bacterium]